MGLSGSTTESTPGQESMKIQSEILKARGKQWTRLIAELVIIFIGVSAAFVLDNYQSERKENFRRQQIYAAFLEEFNTMSRVYTQVVPLIDSLTTTFISEYEQGKMPKLKRLHLAIGSQTDVWDAAIQSGALEILDVDLIFQLSSFYAFKGLVNDEFASFRRLTEQYILPNLDKGSEEFYDSRAKELKEQYRWYLDSMHVIRDYIGQVQKMTDDLLVTIEHHYTE
jgi:hypothetical protein